MDERSNNAVGFFNFAHSYCVSAELYLKSYLLTQGVSLEDIEKKYRHHTRKIANKAKIFGLKLSEIDEQVITQMAESDNVISARYLRLGHHKILPIITYHEVCHRLHHQICEPVYKTLGGARRPMLNAPKANSHIAYRFAESEE